MSNGALDGTSEPTMPPEWTHEPTFATRTALVNSRRQEKLSKSLALAQAHPSPYFDKHFNRTQILFHDCFSSSGAFDMSWKHNQQAASPGGHGSCSLPKTPSALTRSACFQQRRDANRLASLRFQPTDEMRTRDLPKASELTHWWKQMDGYVEDTTQFVANSLRLELKQKATHNGEWTPPHDPARTRTLTKHEFQEKRQGQREVTKKITQIDLLMDETTLLGSEFDKVKHPLPEHSTDGGGGGGGTGSGSGSGDLSNGRRNMHKHMLANRLSSRTSISSEHDSFETDLQLAFSPIKSASPKARLHRSRQRAKDVEEMILTCTNQREQLDRKKQEMQALDQLPVSPMRGGLSSSHTSGLGSPDPRLLSSSSQERRASSPGAVRTGGFQS